MDKNKVMKEIVGLAGFESVDALKQYVSKNGYREEYWMGGIIDALKIIENQPEDTPCKPVLPRCSHYKPNFNKKQKRYCHA